MDEQLRKRLKEAAEKHAIQTLAYFAQHNQTPTHFDWADKVKEEYIAGAELGYKEAIKLAKEWLMNYFFFENSLMSASGCALFLKTFETEMLKLWEEKK